MAKRSLMEPFDVTEIYTSDASITTDIDLNMLTSDVIDILNRHVPSSIRGDYRRFIEGVNLPKHKREKLIDEIRNILHNHYSRKDIEDEDGQV